MYVLYVCSLCLYCIYVLYVGSCMYVLYACILLYVCMYVCMYVCIVSFFFRLQVICLQAPGRFECSTTPLFSMLCLSLSFLYRPISSSLPLHHSLHYLLL